MNYYNESTQALITEVIDRTEALNYSLGEFKTWAGKRLENKPALRINYINSVMDKSKQLDDMLTKVMMSVSICNKATNDLIAKTLQEGYAAIEAAKGFEEDPK
jgi:hypothetical protein